MYQPGIVWLASRASPFSRRSPAKVASLSYIAIAFCINRATLTFFSPVPILQLTRPDSVPPTRRPFVLLLFCFSPSLSGPGYAMAPSLVNTLLTLVTVVIHSGPSVRGEVFTALVHMEGLVSLENDLLGGLESYLHMERQR